MPAPTRRVTIRATVNGDAVTVESDARTLLSDALRRDLGLTGTHVGCEQGVCGACTVLVDGVAVRSCLMFAAQVDGRDVRTVEGLVGDPAFEAVAAALGDNRAMHCGFCTPGIAVSLVALRRRAPVDDDVLLDQLGGHICRCTGYAEILRAGRQALAATPADDVEATP